MKKIIILFTILFTSFNLSAQCFEITNILVDACGDPEGSNEMVRLETSLLPLDINDIFVEWATVGFTWHGACQNANTSSRVNAINASILGCGYVLEPPAGIIPPNSNVIIVTSDTMDVNANNFTYLNDTIYMVFQCAWTTQGHFANYGTPSSTRTLVVGFNSPLNCSDTVSYDRSLLTNIYGLIGGSSSERDGASVSFTPSGVATYYNNGCQAPYFSENPNWSFTDKICNDYGIVDLTTLLAPSATTGGSWFGPHVSGSDYNPSGYLGLDSITYQVLSSTCNDTLDSTIVFQVVQEQQGIVNFQSCDSLNYGGTTFTSDSTFVINFPPSNPYYCDSSFTVNIDITDAIRDSTYYVSCDTFTFNGTTYTSDTILYDTLASGGGSSGASCPEIFFSEYGEGSSSNKYVEIYNGTGVPVDLSNYSITLYSNGSATPTSTQALSGFLAPGDVYVIANGGANATILAAADITSGTVNFNGDDAFALYNGTTLVDLIGNIGCDPGTEWVNGSLTTKDASIIRNSAYTTGVNADPANTPCDFPTLTATNWTNLGNDTWTNIGMHTSDCGGATTSGCDTIVIVNIKIYYSETVVVNDTTCYPSNAGSTTNTFTNQNGCDSTYTHNTYFYPDTVLLEAIICLGDTFTPPQTSSQYYAQGVYWDTVFTSPGCVDYMLESTVYVNNPGPSPLDFPEDSTICAGQSITLGPINYLPPFESLVWEDGSTATTHTITQSGTYWAQFTTPVVACPPFTDTIVVTVITPAADTTSLSSCDSVQFNGNWYTSNTTLIDTMASSLACDSFYHYTVITILPPSSCIINYTCSFDTVLFDSYEYTSTIPGLVPGAVIHTSPRDGTTSTFLNRQHSGQYFFYMNFTNGYSGSVYERVMNVCQGSDFRYSFWIRQYDSGPGSDITINIYDGTSTSGTLLNSQNVVNTGTTYHLISSPQITALGNNITFQIVTNTAGAPGGNDLCLDDLLVEVCQIEPIPFDTIAFCPAGNAQNLFDSISFLNTTGTWSGPSALGNGHLGTFNPLVNTAGTYAYTIAGASACADTVFTITTQLLQDSAESIVDSFCLGTNYLLNGGTIVTVGGTYTDTVSNSVCNTIYTYSLTTYHCLNCNVDLGPDTAFCEGPSLTLDAGPNFDEYLWSDNSTNQTLTVNTTGTYWVQTTVFDTANNLVANGDFSQGNIGFTSDYDYSTSGAIVTCPNGNQSWGITGCEGTYTVINSPNAAHSNFANCGDHTSGTGNMIVVNGSNVPNTSVWCQSVTVNPNTDYVFSAWAMSVENTSISNVATLHFLINGVQIGNNFSPSTIACDWQQFNATWNSGSNSNITICIESDVISGNNDYAIDDIFFTPYCVNSDTIDVTVNPYPVVDLGSDITTCQASAILDATTLNATYEWQDNSTNATYTVTNSGQYYVDVTVNNCTSSDTINVTLNTASSGQTSTTICAGDSAFIANAWQTTAGIYYDTLTASNTCDSILATTLIVQQTQTNASSQTVCSNELPVVIFGNNVSVAGTYYDTIQSAFGCDSLINSITLTINNTDSTTVPMSICAGDSALINGVYQTSSGLYINDTLTGSNGCDLYEYVQLTVNPLPSVMLGNDTSIQEGTNYSINVLNPNAGNTYSWTNSLGETYSGQSITANNTQSAQYVVVATNGNSCSSEDSILITVIPNQDVILAMPTAFSPNGDGLNDVFRPANYEDFDSYLLRIYNRWGELIYEEEGYGAAWNGTYKGYDQNVDVYTYYINATPKNSTEHVVQSGNMTIIR